MVARLRFGIPAVAVTAALLAVAAPAAPADTIGLFAIGDGNAAQGATVEFWGAQWWKDNSVSGGGAPASFKGYTVTVTPTGPCTGTFTFTSAPGNSVDPPASVDPIIQVLVTNDVVKSGPVISGTYTDVVAVATVPGYGPNPGHAGTGTVRGSVCGGGIVS